MLIVISPAKTLDYETPGDHLTSSLPDFMTESKRLVRKLKKLKPDYLEQLMSISPKLALLNWERYQIWHPEFNNQNAKQALLAFKGEVYTGINATSFSVDDFSYANDHLRILSGLYGLLRPLDLIQSYRLEMGTKFETDKWKDLYDFWGDKITKKVNKSIQEQGDDVLINLASNEYFKSIKKKQLKGRIITPAFKDEHNGEYKMISFFAKKARGLMTAWILKNQISDPEQLKLFEEEGYFYNDKLSTDDNPVFTRG